MKWFRFYSGALDDPKVQRLPPELFKGWVNLLCLANEGSPRGTLPSIEDIAFRLRISEEEAVALITALRSRGLIDEAAGTFHPHNWDGRQRRSDNVTERVQKHREKRTSPEGRNVPRNVTGNVTRNTPDTDTEADTDTEQRRNDSSVAPLGAPDGSSPDPSSDGSPPKALRRIYAPDDPYYRLAARLADHIRENNPNHRPILERQIQSWANDARLMTENDRRSLDDSRRLLDWCQQDSFWRANILSMGKFRERWDQLWLLMHRPAPAGHSPPASSRTGLSAQELARRALEGAPPRGAPPPARKEES